MTESTTPQRIRYRPICKEVSYVVQCPAGAEKERLRQTAEHWHGFTWQSGPVVVVWKGEDGRQLRVWGATEAEGIRVIRHMMADIGISEQSGKYLPGTTTHPRFGRIGLIAPSVYSCRRGPSGDASYIGITD